MTKRVRLLVGVTIIALLALVASWKPAAIAYHRRHMLSAWNDMVNDRRPSQVDLFWQQVILGRRNKSYPALQQERYEYHRNGLVEWGDLAHRHFVLRHIIAPSDEATELWRRLIRTFPDNIHATSVWPRSPEPMQIDVWDAPSRIAQWEAFVAEHDVANFRERFMPESEEGTTTSPPVSGLRGKR